MSTDDGHLSIDGDANSADGEGVWSPDVELAFQEALRLHPACGRRKTILADEGASKMYGRNELIARYIKVRTGKTRTRKQVSSHIQVLARRKAKCEGGSSNGGSAASTSGTPSPSSGGSSLSYRPSNGDSNLMLTDGGAHTPTSNGHHNHNLNHHQHLMIHQHPGTPSSAAHMLHNHHHHLDRHHLNHNHNHHHPGSILDGPATAAAAAALTNYQHHQQHYGDPSAAMALQCSLTTTTTTTNDGDTISNNQTAPLDAWRDRPVATAKIRLVEFSAFVEHRNPINSLVIQHPAAAAASGFARHSFVKIDYSQQPGGTPPATPGSSPLLLPGLRGLSSNNHKELERIEFSQLRDKFPGLDDLFQYGSPDAFYLVKFWADLNDTNLTLDDMKDDETNNNNINSAPDHHSQQQQHTQKPPSSYFSFSSHFETIEPYKYIISSTKACSYGHQVIEKVDKIAGAYNNSTGHYSYNNNRSEMCKFMIQFIKKLRQLPMESQMNSVLENFTVLQVIRSESTQEILLCLAYVFQVATAQQLYQNIGAPYHVYKLIKD